MAEFRATFREPESLKVSFKENGSMSASFGETQLVTTSNYEELSKKPQINGVTLIGDQDSPTLHLQGKMDTLTVAEIEKILYVGG